MNNRIKELKAKATSRMIGENNTPYEVLDSEKFAELIVRECAVLVDSNISDNGYGVADSWCEGKDLLKHFGVEE